MHLTLLMKGYDSKQFFEEIGRDLDQRAEDLQNRRWSKLRSRMNEDSL